MTTFWAVRECVYCNEPMIFHQEFDLICSGCGSILTHPLTEVDEWEEEGKNV